MEDYKAENPIAVFDSGVGGISVLREIHRLLPGEDCLFFGDSKNAPYGEKSTDKVLELTSSCVDYFLEKKAKAVVLACNTATSAAAKKLREKYQDLIIIGLEPAVKPAVLWDYKKGGVPARILVMATELTLREKKFLNLASRCRDKAEIISLPAPGLVRLVESGKSGSEEMAEYLEEILAPYKENPVDSVVLGCTHFPFARADIKRILGDVPFFDGAEGAARQLKRRLKEENLLDLSGKKGTITFENSSESGVQLALSKELFSAEI
ncbi:MAG: glutamate racemase [Clostridia bacterium]|nr:glutamate racemase [Clostridia bacterium]